MITGSDPTAELSHSSHAKITSSKYSNEIVAADITHCSEQNHNYQKLDEKALSRPAAYDQVHVVSKQKTTASGSKGGTGKQFSTTSHYESLQLDTMNKRSHYQQIVLKETCQ